MEEIKAKKFRITLPGTNLKAWVTPEELKKYAEAMKKENNTKRSNSQSKK